MKNNPPPPIKRKAPAPPAPPKTKLPPKLEEPKQIESSNTVQNQQSGKIISQQKVDEKVNIQQTQVPSQQKPPEPAQQTKKAQVNSPKAKQPNLKAPPAPNRSVPQPPKINNRNNREKIQNQQITKSSQDYNRQETVTQKPSSQNLQSDALQAPVNTVKQPPSQIITPKIPVPEVKTQKNLTPAEPIKKTGQKTKLEEKLEQLRKAKEQMTQEAQFQQIPVQQNESNPQQEEIIENVTESYGDSQVLQYNDPVIQHEQTTAKQQRNDQPLIEKESQGVLPPNSSFNLQSNNPFQVLPQEKQAQVKPVQVKQKIIPPPSTKKKSAIPPPSIKSAPKPQKKINSPPLQQMPEPKQQKIESTVPQNQEKPVIPQTNIQAEKQQQPSIPPNIEKVEEPKGKKIEIAIAKPTQSLAGNQLNKLLERYHSLKSTYVSNIHQLQQLVNFHKNQEDAQIQKINKLLSELNKKNQHIKEICGLKSQTIIEEVNSEQQQISV